MTSEESAVIEAAEAIERLVATGHFLPNRRLIGAMVVLDSKVRAMHRARAIRVADEPH